MATPFVRHPSLGEYMMWASSQGFDVQTGYGLSRTGKPIDTIRISKGDRWVIITGTPQSERLLASYVAGLDRRLGVKSPFFSFDDEAPDPTESDTPVG